MTSIAAAPQEQLENGHTTSTPPGDNLVLDFAGAVRPRALVRWSRAPAGGSRTTPSST